MFPSCQDKSRQILTLTNGQPVIEKLVWSDPNREISAPLFKDSGSNGSKHKAVHLFIILSYFVSVSRQDPCFLVDEKYQLETLTTALEFRV